MAEGWKTDTDTLVRTSGIWLRVTLLAIMAVIFILFQLLAGPITEGFKIATAAALVSTCDIMLGNRKHGRLAMSEGRSAYWLLLKHALKFWCT